MIREVLTMCSRAIAGGVLAIVGLIAVSASADEKSVVRENIRLFDELVSCSQNSAFRQYGVARTGPCGDWVDHIEAQRTHDRSLIISGFNCLAGDIRSAGNSLVFGDRPHFDFVKSVVEECRAAIR